MSENTAETQTEIISAPKVGGKKVIFAASFGNALEFFDFGIYNFFVIYISVLFFPPSSDPHLALLLAFATFGVSFFMRPLGGILIGAYADRCGRKPAMILTISLMSLGTAMIGFAPTYASAGYWGTATLVAARLIQGVAAGGEVGASMSLLVESAPPHRRGFYSSWSLATQGIATVVGGVTALALSAALPVLSGEPNAMAEWGWRIPFFIGVALAPLGCWLRLGLESDRPSVARAHEPPAQLRQHSRAVVLGVMLTIGATVATYISMYYLGTYAVKYLGMAQAYGYAAMLLAGLITFGGSLLVGRWCDRYGRLPLIRGSRIAILIVALPAFWWLSAVPHPAVLLLIVAVLVGLTTLGSVPTMLMISELFPQRIRALGFALVYSLGVAIFGGFAQYIASQSIALSGSLLAPAVYLMVATLASLAVLPLLRETGGEPLR
ncbi:MULTISPECIES: MFS transporter [Serratia]|uniref:Major facilitator superfamily protein n=3 Tax=Serratia TaxID=613 RepID=A0ABC9IIZ7_SERMA|nr:MULTISPECIES: MFS transporter [Serratia]PIJ09033.1 MFS transporter [Serratia sp. OMLW3]PIJ15388.1 MFS transporter [Serratia sp. OLAL2]CDG12469.1 major facilitator superfamily protein [Serratia marcescens subsp. marcescens Db11]HEJ0102886.1 MFS transporter [Serratia marcescens]